MSYRDLLRRPEWQKRRLEMLTIRDWTCKKCGDKRSQLQVHHVEYVAGRMPWEYGDNELIVLCDQCHEAEHNQEATKEEKALEYRIERAREALTQADPGEKKIAWAVLASLLRERSPQRVKEMEYARGLR